MACTPISLSDDDDDDAAARVTQMEFIETSFL